MRHFASRLLAALSATVIVTPSASAQSSTPPDTAARTPDVVRHAQLARRGGGLRVGPWHLNGQQSSTGSASSIPDFEGYVGTGLDAHLVLENSVGVWRQRQSSAASGGFLGASGSVNDAYVIPQFTSIVFYPMTMPNDRLEPFIRGGIGFALGVEDPQSGGGSMSFTPGFGLTSGLGVEWRVTQALGLAISTRYQWIRFFQEFGLQQTYQGPVVEAGITYRFQYR